MNARSWLLALLLCLLPTWPAVATDAKVARFAIVIGNNRPEQSKNPTLRYADDDAVATHRLLREAGVDSVLLVTLDSDSQRLNQGLGPHGAPRAKALDAAFLAMSARIRKAATRGLRTEFLFFYSGHGDVDRGEGYVILEDGRLTRAKLYSLLAASPALRNQVFVDACKSYFLAFDKGPGGRRTSYTRSFGGAIPARLSNTGFVLSTSSDRESHEWERYQAGVMSHELRSALRGAADVNGDGSVTYAELGGFLATANQSIPNPKFRPDFMVRAPDRNLQEEVLRWDYDWAALRLDGESLGHIYVETPSGERLLDAHAAGKQALTVHVPDERPLFVRRNDETAEYVVTSLANARLAMLEPRPPEVGHKGALHFAFEKLFDVPFGLGNVAAFERFQANEMAQSDAIAERLHKRQAIAMVAGAVAIGAAAGGLALGGLAVERYMGGDGSSQRDIDSRNRVGFDLKLASIALFAVAGAAGLTWGWTQLSSDALVSVQTIAAGDARGRGAVLNLTKHF